MSDRVGIRTFQPWGWLVGKRKLRVVNCHAAPAPNLIGRRIYLIADEVDPWYSWFVRERWGIELPRQYAQLASERREWRQSTRLGLVASAKLVGWIESKGRERIVHRPDGKARFTGVLGVTGPASWVFSAAQLDGGDKSDIRLLPTGYHDQQRVRSAIVRYAKEHGTDALNRDQVEVLRAEGFQI